MTSYDVSGCVHGGHVRRVTNCPGMPGTVPESRVCVPHPGQKQSGTIKCPGIGSTALIMVNELLHLARVGMKLTLSKPGKSQVSRGDPAGQGQTGEAWSRKICEEWDLPGKRRRWQLSTDKNGVGVWPNTFTWTWDESSQVKSM